jgi:hypothetical protein
MFLKPSYFVLGHIFNHYTYSKGNSQFFSTLSNIIFFFYLKDITFYLNDRVPLVLTGNEYVIKYFQLCLVTFQIGYENQTGKTIKERHCTVSIDKY